MEDRQDINQNQYQSHGAYHPSHNTIPRSSHSVNRRSVASDGSGSGVHWKVFNQNRHRAAFIRDLPFHCTSEDLRKFICFTLPSLALSLEEVTVRYGQHGKSLQVAGVLFRDEDSATMAIEHLHGQRYEGRDLRVSSYNPQAQMETSKVAEIRFSFTSLSQTMQRITEAVIREGFEKEFGPLQDVGIRLHRVSSDGTQTGYGFMTFHNPEHNQTVAENCRAYELNQIRFECSWSSQHAQPEAIDGYDELASSTPRSQPLSRNASYSKYSSTSVSPIPSSTDAATMSSTSGYPLQMSVGHLPHNNEGDVNPSTQYAISAPPPITNSGPYNNHIHMVPQQLPMQSYMMPPPSLTTSTSYVPIPPPPTLTNLPPTLPPLHSIMTYHPANPSHQVPVHVLSPRSSSSNAPSTNATSNNNHSINSVNTHSFNSAGLPPPVASSSSSSVMTASGYYAPQQQYVYGSQVPPSLSNAAFSTPSSAVLVSSVASSNGNLVNPYQFQSPTSSYHHYVYNGYPSSVAATPTSNLVSPSHMMHDQHSVGNNFGSNNNNQHNHFDNHGINSNSNHGNKNRGDNSLKASINSNSGDIKNHDINHGMDNKVPNSPQSSSQNLQHPSYNHTQSTGNHHQYNNNNNANNVNDISNNSNHYSTHTISSSNVPEMYSLTPYHSQPQHQHAQTQQIHSTLPIPQYYQAYNPHLAAHPTYPLTAGYAAQAMLSQHQQQQPSHPQQQQQPGNLMYVYYANNNNNNGNSNNSNIPNFAQSAMSYPPSQPNTNINNVNGSYPPSTFQQPPNFHPTH